MTTFGTGDYGGYNDWAFSGANSFWTNWQTSSFTTGALGRATAIAARWDGYSGFCTGSSGHNDLWNASGNALAGNTGNFGVTDRGAGTAATMHNAGITDLWTAQASFFIGFWRVAAKCHIHSWKDSTQGGYAGKSADDGTNAGGTANWGGTTNGGLPVFGTFVPSGFYVRRAGSMGREFFKVNRGGAMGGPVYVRVRRGGTWTPVNLIEWLQQGRHIPAAGLHIQADFGLGVEDAWMVEEAPAWFGNVEAPRLRVPDWTKPFHLPVELPAFGGRYNSFESDELADSRMYAHDRWQRALDAGDEREVEHWGRLWQPEAKVVLRPSRKVFSAKVCDCPNLYPWEREAMRKLAA